MTSQQKEILERNSPSDTPLYIDVDGKGNGKKRQYCIFMGQ